MLPASGQVAGTAGSAAPRPTDPDARVDRDLEFARAGERVLLLDLYRPQHAPSALPVIVSIHGGGWHGGTKERSPGLHFTRHGYAVASIEYRLTGEATFPSQIHDCKAAVRWLRANAGRYGLDPERFGAWGASAGGHLAALLGTSGGVAELEGELGNPTRSSRIQAVVDFFGPIDVAGWHRYKGETKANLIGAPIAGNEARLAKADPTTYIDAGDPPVLVAHGERDTLVPKAQSELLHAALRGAGVESTLVLVPGAAHSVQELDLDARVLAFLDRHLK
jgi:acetyl esterase/lipase